MGLLCRTNLAFQVMLSCKCGSVVGGWGTRDDNGRHDKRSDYRNAADIDIQKHGSKRRVRWKRTEGRKKEGRFGLFK